jgi:hypothetical protein
MTQHYNSFTTDAPLIRGGYGYTTMPLLSMTGNSCIMAASLIQSGYHPATMPLFNMMGNPSTMSAPCRQGGYTSFLLGVDQDATLRSAVRKLHFDGEL